MKRKLLFLTMLAMVPIAAQNPTPAEGTDGSRFRIIAVDAMGRIVIANPGSFTGCPGTTVSPCVVAGQDAGAVTRILKLDPLGETVPANASSAGADAISNTGLGLTDATGGQVYNRNWSMYFNGATWDRARGNTSGAFVQGPVADGATAAGNPVEVAGVDGLGVARHLSTSANGDLAIGVQVAGADAVANNWNFTVSGQGLTTAPLAVFHSLFNGTSWDRARGNTSGAAPTNASLAGADGVSNTQVSPTDVVSTQIYNRVMASLFNGTSWDRARGNISGAAPTNASLAGADGVSNTQVSPTDVVSAQIYNRVMASLFNGTTWDRARGNTSGAAPTNASLAGADGVSNTELSATDVAGTQIYNRVMASLFNGTTWDRARGNTNGEFVQGPAAAGAAIAGNPVPTGGTDGTNVQYAKLNSAGNNTAATNNNAVMTEKGGRFSVISSPAVSAQATATKAAGAGAVRHVADCITFAAAGGGAVAATTIGINLRDGATGAGTIILTEVYSFLGTNGQQLAPPFAICGLNLIGSPATAMTLEFTGGVTNLFESVTLTGYDLN